jgi:hypothetical protein
MHNHMIAITTITDDNIRDVIRGLDNAGRNIRDMEADAGHLGLSKQDAAALRVASALLTSVLTAIDPYSSSRTPEHHMGVAIAASAAMPRR